MKINASKTKTRGFYQTTINDCDCVMCEIGGLHNQTVYVRKGFVIRKCKGEAHSNAHIDHCASCLSAFFGWQAVPEFGYLHSHKTFRTLRPATREERAAYDAAGCDIEVDGHPCSVFDPA